jgi:hypothetical protein
MKKLMKKSLMLAAILVVAACGSTTSITGSYKAPGVGEVGYKKVFVSALNDKIAVRQSVESEIANYLNSKGYTAVKSTDIFPANFHSSGNDKDKDAVLKAIRETNADGILTLALVNKENETRYVPGSGGYPVGGYYGTFGAYYGYGYNSFYSPGYYTNDKIYYVETNLYDAKTENLVWSAQSKTVNPSSIDDFMKGYEKAIAEQLIKDGLVKPAAKK